MKDLMIDIETMGNTHNAAMLQIAGVFFDRTTKELGDSFCQEIDLQSCLDLGFEENESTRQWWSEQNPEVLKNILSNGLPVHEVINNFYKFIKPTKDLIVWSHATFDFVIVQNYLKILNIGYLPYRGARDIRTLVDLSGIDLNKYDWSKGKTHNALDDCRFQINYCVDAINQLIGE